MAISQIWTKRKAIAAFLQLSIFVRYIEVLKEPGARIGNSKKHSNTLLLARLRYVETITENAPQLCLQVYIMLFQRYYPLYTLFSAALSLFSLVWCITALEAENNAKLECKRASIFSCWQTFTLVSRISAIALFAYVFPTEYLTIFIVVHLSAVTVIIFTIEIHNGGGLQKSFWLLLPAAYPFLFHSAYNLLGLHAECPKREMKLGYILLILENVIISILSLTIGKHYVADRDIVVPISFGGVLVEILFSVASFCAYSADNFYHVHVDPQPAPEI